MKTKLEQKQAEYIKTLKKVLYRNNPELSGLTTQDEIAFEHYESEIYALECLNKSDKQYHLNCDKCGDLFWSNEAFPKTQLCQKCEENETILVDDPHYTNLGREIKKSDYIQQFKNDKSVLSAEEFVEGYGYHKYNSIPFASAIYLLEIYANQFSQSPAIIFPTEDQIKTSCPQSIVQRISCWIQGAKFVIEWIKENNQFSQVKEKEELAFKSELRETLGINTPDKEKIYISPLHETVSIYIDNKWKIFRIIDN